MRIESDSLVNSAATKTTGAEATRGADRTNTSRTQVPVAGDSEDRVDLSSLTGRIANANGIISADRAARVNSLTQTYQAGNYHPDVASLSRKLVDQWLR